MASFKAQSAENDTLRRNFAFEVPYSISIRYGSEAASVLMAHGSKSAQLVTTRGQRGMEDFFRHGSRQPGRSCIVGAVGPREKQGDKALRCWCYTLVFESVYIQRLPTTHLLFAPRQNQGKPSAVWIDRRSRDVIHHEIFNLCYFSLAFGRLLLWCCHQGNHSRR